MGGVYNFILFLAYFVYRTRLVRKDIDNVGKMKAELLLFVAVWSNG